MKNKRLSGLRNFLLGIVFYIILICTALSSGAQTTTTTYKVKRTYDVDSIVVTNTITNTVTIYPDTAAILALKCSTVVQPPTISAKLQSIYVVLDDVISDIDGWISYWSLCKVNETNLYARSYVTTASKRPKLSDVIAKLHAKGIKVNIDYRLTSELPSWDAYFTTYTNPINRPDGMVTEREPYITGDYTGFYTFIQQGDVFAAKWNIGLYCYMGHPTQQAWDSIIVHCDRVYLSNYISMSVYTSAEGQYRYVSGRWQYITNSAKKVGKLDYPVAYIKSLERKIWGASNDFMGEAYIGGSFYGPIMTQGFEQYEKNATAEIKMYTDLIGDCIFHHKYGVLAIPR